MAIPTTAWGIDVGNRALKAIKLTRTADGFAITDFAVIEHENVLSNAGDNRESLIQSALANFAASHNIKNAPVAVGVSGQASFARFIKLPPVEPKKIPEIVRFEAIQQIPFPLDDVEWSYQLFQDEASPDVEVGIFAMRKELVNHHIQYFTSAGLDVQAVQMNPLAVYNAMHFDQHLKGTTMIIDLGAENTDLIIAEGETVWLRSIPIGGNNFTEALVKGFKLRFEKAEELKRNAATSKYGRQILQAMRPIFADLVAEIQRSIGFYASVHRDSKISKVLALGGTFRLPGLQKYLQQNLSLEVQRIDHLGSTGPADTKVATTLNENILSAPGAYGLALQALGQGKISSSLLPQKIRKEKLWKEKTKWFAAAAAMIVLGTGVAVGRLYYDRYQYDQAQAARGDIQRVYKEAKDRSGEWQTIENAGAPDRKQIADVKTLTSYRDLWLNLYTDINNGLPKDLVGATPEKLKQVPRGQRRQVWIDQLQSQYYNDISGILAAPEGEFNGNMKQWDPTPAGGSRHLGGLTDGGLQARAGTGMPGMMPGMDPRMVMMMYSVMMRQRAAAPGAAGAAGGMAGLPGGMNLPGMPLKAAPPDAPRGFLITLHCVTPNANAITLLNDTLMKALREKGDPEPVKAGQPAQPIKPYSFSRITIPNYVKLVNDQSRLNTLQQRAAAAKARREQAAQSASNPTPMFNPLMPVPGFDPRKPVTQPLSPTAAPVEENLLVDPITGEDIRQDYDVTVLAAVVLEPKPKTPEEANAQ